MVDSFPARYTKTIAHLTHFNMANANVGNNICRPDRPNSDSGWNDPPIFTYNAASQGQSSPRRNILMQRAGRPQPPPHTSPKGVTPRTVQHPKAPPIQGTTCTLTGPAVVLGSNEVNNEQDDDSSELPADVRDVSVAKLQGVLEKCSEKLKARVADDIKKRIDMLNNAWQTGKLSTAVQRRMANLATELSERQYNKAHAVHLSLIVDYISEVSQWMVGIKRLIMEADAILPMPVAIETNDGETEDNRGNTDEGRNNDDCIKHAIEDDSGEVSVINDAGIIIPALAAMEMDDDEHNLSNQEDGHNKKDEIEEQSALLMKTQDDSEHVSVIDDAVLILPTSVTDTTDECEKKLDNQDEEHAILLANKQDDSELASTDGDVGDEEQSLLNKEETDTTLSQDDKVTMIEPNDVRPDTTKENCLSTNEML